MKAFAEHVCLRDLALSTQQGYYRQIRLVAERHGKDPKLLGQKRIQSYIVHLREERGWSASSVRQAVACLRAFYGEMLGKDWDLWRHARSRERRRLPVVLDIGQVSRVLKSVALLRHRVPLRLIYCCGLRLDECVRLTVDDIEPGAVIARQGKGGKERRVPLSEPVYRELQRHWLQHRNPKWLFPTPGRGRCENARERMGRSAEPMGKGSLQKAFHDAVVASGIRRKATIHTLRHSYATHLLAMGVNIRQLQLYLGHEDIETTTIYLHLIPFGEERSMKRVDAIARMTR